MSSNFIGLISGTSADGIDAIAVSIDQQNNIQQLASLAYPINSSIRDKIFSIQKNDIPLNQLGELDTELGEVFANAALELINTHNLDQNDIQAIGCHGQTLKHDPDCNHPYTIQVANPSIIAERTNITVVADFRRRDIAAGGQGAPLVPAFHQAWLGKHEDTVVLNMGGIANITVLSNESSQPQSGFDTGPANTLIDSWTNKHLHTPYDNDGQWAQSGTVNKSLLQSLLKHPYFRKQPPKSADISQFNIEWLENFLQLFPEVSPQDVSTTLVALSVKSIANAIEAWAPETKLVIACGGGCKNKYLMQELKKQIHPIRLTTTNEFGIDSDWIEATAFAWLGKQALEKQPGNSPNSTGASGPRILGAIYHK